MERWQVRHALICVIGKSCEANPSASSNLALSASKEGSGILPEPSFGLIGTFVVL